MANPLPICHLNGEWLPLAEARISPLDRSFLFGDGVYEVVPVFQGRPFRFMEHFDRLARSCCELRLRDPYDRDGWRALVRELGLSVLIVTHDIAAARLLADRILVMRRGQVVEQGLTDRVLDDPQHPYTQLLVSSVLAA